MTRICKKYDANLKSEVAISYLQNPNTTEISAKFNVPKTNILDWKNKLIDEASHLFVSESESDKENKNLKKEIENLQRIIGEITIENNFLKKKLKL